ncbi:MAG TPA: NAD-binding protein [Thiohalobacter sp.]|nr:NAD-binding protein [Thiohalobacter sp.]
MEQIVFLVFRRMRRPLIAIMAAYSISVLGFMLIPGRDDAGNVWHMDFFHAFYFVSFMGSTIGFGEIPYAFTPAQRGWATLSIYLTVVSWLYGIGSLLTIVQDRTFRRALEFSGFRRRVKRLYTPFYIVCGYDDTGTLLVEELTARGIGCSVLDIDSGRIDALQLQDLPMFVPGLRADASDSEALAAAGLRHPDCRGVIAVTDDDRVNLRIAITCKLLSPDKQMISRVQTRDMAANLASFGTDFIINPFETFSDRFAMLFHSPSMYLIYEWITSIHNAPLKDFVTPPPGKWILCGYGRFGKALRRELDVEGVETRIIEADPGRTEPPEGTVIGRGTEAETLIAAGIESAAGLIAATDDDSNNLSILITAKDINEDLFTVARQNERRSDDIFGAFAPDFIMQPSTITVRGILSRIITPLLQDFLDIARKKDEDWANLLVSRVSGVVTDRAPELWALSLDAEHAGALHDLLGQGRQVPLCRITRDPQDCEQGLALVVLLVKRGGDTFLLPEDEFELERGDRLLLCGVGEARRQLELSVQNYNVLNYLLTGEDRPDGLIWRLLRRGRGVEHPDTVP